MTHPWTGSYADPNVSAAQAERNAKAAERASGFAPDFVLGLDLGRAMDFTAVCVLERTRRASQSRPGRFENFYSLRHLHRWPLRTSYPSIVADICKLVVRAPLFRPMMAVDQTGVGEAVVDMLAQANVQCDLRPILITCGHEITLERGVYHVPKKELVSTIQVMLQTRRIKFAPVPQLKILLKELQNFKMRIALDGSGETFNWRDKDHDDCVLAVALSCWLGEERPMIPMETWPTIANKPKERADKRLAGGGNNVSPMAQVADAAAQAALMQPYQPEA